VKRGACLSRIGTRASRRDTCSTTLSACIASIVNTLAATGNAQAAYVDEEVAQSVFSVASLSAVAIEDFESGVGGLVAEGVGSGFVWDNFGHIVTNYHCISKLAQDQSGRQVAPKSPCAITTSAWALALVVPGEHIILCLRNIVPVVNSPLLASKGLLDLCNLQPLAKNIDQCQAKRPVNY
jgi:hypothetical protein